MSALDSEFAPTPRKHVRRISLRRWAMLGVVALIAVVIAPFAVLLASREHHRVEQELQRQLVAMSRVYATLIDHSKLPAHEQLRALPLEEWEPMLYVALLEGRQERRQERVARRVGAEVLSELQAVVPSRYFHRVTEVEGLKPSGFFHEEGHVFQVRIPLAVSKETARSLVCVASTRAANREVAEAMRFVWVWAALALVGGVLAVALVDWILRRNVRALIDLVEHVEAGTLDQKAEVHTGDDLERLGAAFNRMAAAVAIRERELVETKATLQSIFDGIQAGITYVSRDYQVILANRFQETMFEKAPGAFQGRFCYKSFEKRPEVCAHCPGTIAMKERRAASIETEGVLDNGRRIAVHIDAYPVFDGDGEVSGFIEYVRDTTEQRAMERQIREYSDRLEELVAARTLELRHAQAQVTHSEKMASIGLMAAGIAHEIGNPLTALRSMMVLLEKEQQLPSHQEKISVIRVQIDRIAGVVQNLVRFARPASRELRMENLNELVESVVGLARYQHPERNIELVCVLDRKLPRVKTVAGHVHQVLLNLILNAFDVLSECGGRVTVSTLGAASRALVKVRDNGPGIDADHLARIFEPFFTTKPEGSGTGLGLSVARDLARELGGELLVENRSEGGAEFCLALPLTNSAADPL